ncbi:pyrin-like [Danio rerio]|uniref:Pyrin-like n=1 Tax=Danio rerio TaxID=7955 RepID=A0AC58G257_DANRE
MAEEHCLCLFIGEVLITEIGRIQRFAGMCTNHFSMMNVHLAHPVMGNLLYFFDTVDIILDTETAHPDLEVSTNGKAVRDSGRNSGKSRGLNRFDQDGGILGKSSITSGRAFWMVDVGRKVGWQLGVMREGANMKGKISYKPSKGYWVIVLCGSNMYGAFEDPPIMLQLSSNPQKLGVYVDCEAALVSFYDMEAQTHIYTYRECRFNGAIRPYFNPHVNRDGNNGSPLVICDVKHSDFCT